MEPRSLKLKKQEKLCSITAIDALFAGNGSKSALAYPLRMVTASRTEHRRPGAAPVQFMISVPKKRLRHAVDRVQMRRRIREAYRLNRESIPADFSSKLDVAFIYVAPKLEPYFKVERAMVKLLSSLGQ